jgi:phenylpyruvate tautomerase PptA (4-oxalocrotonate tautomerase family)
MPVLTLTTNSDVDISTGVLGKFSSGVAEMLGKHESYVMVQLQHNAMMLFAGSDAPLAYAELKSIALPQEHTADFSARLCSLIASELNIPENRIYIEFSDLQRHLFGWSGKTF